MSLFRGKEQPQQQQPVMPPTSREIMEQSLNRIENDMRQPQQQSQEEITQEQFNNFIISKMQKFEMVVEKIAADHDYMIRKYIEFLEKDKDKK